MDPLVLRGRVYVAGVLCLLRVKAEVTSPERRDVSQPRRDERRVQPKGLGHRNAYVEPGLVGRAIGGRVAQLPARIRGVDAIVLGP